MTVVNVYDMSFNLIGVIDDYVSIIWRPSYYDVGDFEIYLGAESTAVKLLQEDRLVVRDSDVLTDDSGNVTYRNVMIIKNINISTDVEDGDFLLVSGRELKYLLHSRIVWSQTNLTDTAEAGIRKLVDDNAVNPVDSKRKIPNLLLGAAAGLTDSISKQVTGAQLDEAITNICIAYDYGWDVYGYNNNYVFIVYKGVDRSYSQNINPYVVFSDNFDNLYNTEYQLLTEEYANTALVAGEGEGTARKTTTINNEAVGLSRYEAYVDARDLSQNKDSSDPAEIINDADYLKLLTERGKEKLAECAITEGFSGNVLSASGSNYVYNVDFYLGDTVTVINSYGIQKNVKVLSAIESEDEKGVTFIPQFNI